MDNLRTNYIIFSLFIILCIKFVAPLVDKDGTGSLEWMEKYHYIPKKAEGKPEALMDAETLEKILLDVQYMAGINQTGVLDEETINIMNTPRCSVSDLGIDETDTDIKRRRKRFSVRSYGWRTKDITYNFDSYENKQFGTAGTERIFKKAFKMWSDVSDFNFNKLDNYRYSNHIEILFGSGEHGDGDPFDGPGNTLAHAYFPDSGIGGDAHFDADEDWREDSYFYGKDLFQVATHELGHSLGLGHSNDRDAVMYAYYLGYKSNFRITQDDINGLNRIYGTPNRPSGGEDTTTTTTTAKTTTTTTAKTTTTQRSGNQPPVTTTVRRVQQTPTPTPTSRRPSSQPDYCNNGHIDVIILVDGTTYAFQGNYYFVLNAYGVTSGYPRLIQSMWPQLDSVDAALYYEALSDGEVPHLFLFKGTQYWRYSNVNQLDSGYPRDIASSFPGIPPNLKAAFVWPKNGKTYFFKDHVYYRYTRGEGMDAGYPKSMSLWRDIPESIDAVFVWTNGKSYFFAGQEYYRFNDDDIRVDEGGYPRQTAEWWFGCQSASIVENSDIRHEDDNGANGVERGVGLTTHVYLGLFLLTLILTKA